MKLALNMKFQLLELNLPFPDKIAKSLAETLRISRNRPLKWVNRLISMGQKPEIWRPLKEVKFPGSLSDTKKNLTEGPGLPQRGLEMSTRNWTYSGGWPGWPLKC